MADKNGLACVHGVGSLLHLICWIIPLVLKEARLETNEETNPLGCGESPTPAYTPQPKLVLQISEAQP